MKAEKKAKTTVAPAPLTDELIDSGADLSAFMGDARATPAMLEPQKVNVDFPAWVVQALDREADRIGVPRQSLIKMWIAERIERPAALKGNAIDCTYIETKDGFLLTGAGAPPRGGLNEGMRFQYVVATDRAERNG